MKLKEKKMFKIKIKVNEEKKKLIITTTEGEEKCKEVFTFKKDYNPDSRFYCFRSRLEDVGYSIDNHIENIFGRWYNENKGEKNDK